MIDSKIYYVYRHIRLDKNEPFYIGIGTKNNLSNCNTEIYKRAFRKSKERNYHWFNIISITNYDIEIIYESTDLKAIKEKEKEFIKLYGRRDLGTGTLVNLTDGGDGNFNYSDETKQKLRNSKLGKKVKPHIKELLLHYAKQKRSEETINKMREHGKKMAYLVAGHKKSDEEKLKISIKNSKAIVQLDLNNNFIKEWSSIKEAEMALNTKSIGDVVRGRNKTCKGFIWKFKNKEVKNA